MIPAKLATLDLLRIKVFWSKGYDVKISVHEVTNKILSCDPNYMIGMVMWPKFGNKFVQIWPENQFYWRVLVQVPWLGTDTRYSLEILNQCEKRVETKSQKNFGATTYICRSFRGKTVREGLFALPLSWIWSKALFQ